MEKQIGKLKIACGDSANTDLSSFWTVGPLLQRVIMKEVGCIEA